MKARLLLVAVVLACSRKPPPPPPAAPAEVGQAAAAPAPAPAPSAAAKPVAAKPMAAEPEYRGDPAKFIDPATVGTGKHFLAVSESTYASKVGSDVMASGGNAVDA